MAVLPVVSRTWSSVWLGPAWIDPNSASGWCSVSVHVLGVGRAILDQYGRREDDEPGKSRYA
jgi:hypothetical protein